MFDFSIITVSYNSAKTIAETIQSVLSQKDVSFEYIIIDGGSKDETLNIIKSFKDNRIKLISEPDDGLYDAMNKGIKLATGKIIAIINSDDVYIDDAILKLVNNKFKTSNVDVLSGHIYYFDDVISEKKRVYKCTEYKNSTQWINGWQPPHPSTFITKKVYNDIGCYNINYKISADYDLLFRALYIKGYKHGVIDEFLVAMRNGGESTKNLSAIFNGNKEVALVWGNQGLDVPKGLLVKKVIGKIFNRFSN
jgi:glycosyltransferase involved in cell wall biosynthesis